MNDIREIENFRSLTTAKLIDIFAVYIKIFSFYADLMNFLTETFSFTH